MAKVFHKKSQKASLLSLRNSKDRDLLDTLGTAMEAEEVPLTKKGKLSTEKDNGRGYQNQFFNEAKSSEFEENIGISNELAPLFGSNDVINKEEMFKKSSTLRILMVALNPAMRRMSQFACLPNCGRKIRFSGGRLHQSSVSRFNSFKKSKNIKIYSSFPKISAFCI